MKGPLIAEAHILGTKVPWGAEGSLGVQKPRLLGSPLFEENLMPDAVT